MFLISHNGEPTAGFTTSDATLDYLKHQTNQPGDWTVALVHTPRNVPDLVALLEALSNSTTRPPVGFHRNHDGTMHALDNPGLELSPYDVIQAASDAS